MVRDPAYVVVGHLSKLHGTKGEFYVWPLTDHAETTFVPGAALLISDHEGDAPDDLLPEVRVSEVRPYRKGFLILFEGIEDRDRADLLRNRYLLRPFEETDPLAVDELFYHQLLGLRVRTADGVEVGRIREIYGLTPAELLDVTGPGGEILIPFTKEIVVGWDLEEGTLTVDPPEGLLDL